MFALSFINRLIGGTGEEDITPPQAPLPKDVEGEPHSLFLVISSPSGCGKTTMCRALKAADSNIRDSISATTRGMRKGEADGKDYYFLKRPDFVKRVKDGKFLEYAAIFGNLYGTPLEPVQNMRKEGYDILFDVDYQGAHQIHTSAPGQVVRIFVLPPSMKELARRLRSRGTETEEQIARRLSRAHSEISHGLTYDYIIINDDKDAACAELIEIVKKERQKAKDLQTGQVHGLKLLKEKF